jgi:hypothetical protein
MTTEAFKIETRQVIIKPVTRAKFGKISAHSGTGTSFEGAQMDSATGYYKTGLSKEEEKFFEEELALPKGTLAKTNGAFWGSCLNLRIPNDKQYIFNIGTIMDEIKFRALTNRGNVAKNEILLKSTPMAEFYVVDEEAKAKVEELEIDYKLECYDAYKELSLDERKGYLKLFGGYRGLDTMSEKVVNTSLFKEIEKNPAKFMSFVKNPDVKLMIDIEEMIEAGVLVKKGSFYTYQNETIGNSVDAVVAFFKDLRNQSIKLSADAIVKKNKAGK